MKLRNPFLILPTNIRKRLLLPLSVMVVGFIFVFSTTGASLNTASAPYGVVSLELAGDAQSTEAILNSWGIDDLIRVSFGLGLDFLFILVYTFALGLLCTASEIALNSRKLPFASLGPILAWSIIAAGLFDVIENIALVNMLFFIVEPPWPQIASWSAGVKFTLLFGGIVYIFFGWAASLVKMLSEGRK